MTAVSDHIANHLRRVFRYKGNLRTIPNALTSDLFAWGLRREGRKNGKGVTFATVLCGWGKLKNNATALSAFHQVRRTLPDARLLMFGADHAPGEKAEQWARANNLVEGVEFAGMVPHSTLIGRLATEADVLVHPSREEACPMAVAEAMALGMPILGGKRAGGVPELLDHGEAGFLVDVNSAKQVAAAMLCMARDAHLRSQFGNMARNSAQSKLTSAAVFSAYEDAYREVVDQTRLGARR